MVATDARIVQTWTSKSAALRSSRRDDASDHPDSSKKSGMQRPSLVHKSRESGRLLNDFFDLGQKQLGVLCADVSGKGVSAALMMANLQAVARAHVGAFPGGSAPPPALFVQRLNEDFVGRFGNNRYVTLFWAEYDAQAR